jgi:cytochrome oxidase Cu insertion factor (SCO1/SenC/PrrC family)
MSATERLSASGAAALAEVKRREAAGDPSRTLFDLLREQAPIYQGMRAADAEIVRANCMAALVRSGLSDEALPYALEDVATGERAYPVAAAARALRSVGRGAPAGASELLEAALHRFADSSEPVDLGDPDGRPTTAHTEIARALLCFDSGGQNIEHARLGESPAGPLAASTCCHRRAPNGQRNVSAGTAPQQRGEHQGLSLSDCRLQDQDGHWTTYGDLFTGRAAVVAFFYTRCMNPQMCSATVTRLGTLRHLLNERGLSEVMVAGLTYDPAYDTPARLRAYGAERAFPFGPTARLLRAPEHFDRLAAAFELGVGYGPVTVNRHRLEMHVLSPSGDAIGEFLRRTWDPDEVIRVLADSST